MKFASYSFLVAILLLIGCKEKINIQVADRDPILVVEGEVTTEADSSYVRLSLSTNYFVAGKPPIVNNATVNVNGVNFAFVPSQSLYRPAKGYLGKTDSIYNLLINYNNKTYSASTKLERMFKIDSFFQTWKEAEPPFLPSGYSVSYSAFDSRPQTKYTYFVNGYFDTITQRDSFGGNQILFDNSFTPINERYVFEIPFARFNAGDEYIAIFRSIDRNMNDFIAAYGNQNPNIPGPFQVPPANLPTNIVGGAVGYFAGYDVQRWRYRVK
jgi:hypothetical protein